MFQYLFPDKTWHGKKDSKGFRILSGQTVNWDHLLLDDVVSILKHHILYEDGRLMFHCALFDSVLRTHTCNRIDPGFMLQLIVYLCVLIKQSRHRTLRYLLSRVLAFLLHALCCHRFNCRRFAGYNQTLRTSNTR